jgi:thymidylate kinase
MMLQQTVQKPSVILTERCIESAEPFLKASIENGWVTMPEYKLLKNLNQSYEIPEPNVYIYLRINPALIMSRSNLEEKDIPSTMLPNYIEQLHRLHDAWLLSKPEPQKVIVINNPTSYEEAYQEVAKIIKEKIALYNDQ